MYRAIFSPDEKLLASSSRDLTAKIWDVATGRELQKLSGYRCSVKAVAFSPDGQTVAASGNDGMLKLWDVRTGAELKSLVHINSADIDMAAYSLVFSRDGEKIYAGNGDGTLYYPGTPARIGGKHDVPVESLRIVQIQRGLQDHAYLALCSRLGDARLAKAEALAIAPSLRGWARDPLAYQAARERLAARIEALSADRRAGALPLGHVE